VEKTIYIIVGASGEIGNRIATNLLEKTPNVFLTYSNSDISNSESLNWHKVDVTSIESISNFAQLIEEQLPGSVKLVYCAGYLDDHPISLISYDSWSKIIDINLTGAFLFLKCFFNLLSLSKNGRIILLGSVASKKAAIGQAAYSASKAGLEGLCRVAALELGRFGTTCNVVAPGAVESSMFRQTPPEVVKNITKSTPLRKLGTVEDVSKIVEFILSDSSGHITGQTFYIDGGVSIL